MGNSKRERDVALFACVDEDEDLNRDLLLLLFDDEYTLEFKSSMGTDT